MYQNSGGVLYPKKQNDPFSFTFKADGSVKADSSATAGPSIQNAVLGHQISSKKFPTSGISTTPIFERAKYYATNGGQFSLGYVFKLDRKLFEKFGVEEYIVSSWVENPSKPEDEEVILVFHPLKKLPARAIAKVIEVSAQPGAAH